MKLNVNQIYKETNHRIKELFFLLLKKLSLLYILIFIPLIVIIKFFEIEQFFLYMFVMYAIIYVLFSITVYRIILLDDNAVSKYGYWNWSKREWIFLKYIIIITIFIEALPYSIIEGINFYYPFFSMGFENLLFFIWITILPNKMYLLLSVTVVILFIFTFFWASRLSMVFPALTIGKEETSLKWAIKITKGNGWRLFWINSLPIFIKFYLFDVSTIFERIEKIFGVYVFLILMILILSFLFIYQITLVAISFRHLEDDGV